MANTRFEPRRELGRTGFLATRLGIGDLADRAVPLESCVATLRRALDFGLNVVDTAPSYEEGYSEQVVGSALKGRREGVFLIDKIDHFDRPVAAQIDGSLARLQLPSVDLFVFHGVSELPLVSQLLAPGGAWDELDSCRRAGKCRFVGISSHHPGVLDAVLDSGRADVLMFPVGPFVDSRYVDAVLPRARAHGVGTVGFKTFGAGKLVGDTEGYGRPLAARPRGKLSSGGHDDAAPTLPHLTVEQCLHYTLTLDPDVALLGMSFPNEQDASMAAAERFDRPLDEEALRQIREAAARAMQGKGPSWWNPPPDS